MKAQNRKENLVSNAYEVEKNLRVFADLTSESLSTLLGALTAELEEGLAATDVQLKDKALKTSLKALDQALFISRNLRYFSRKSRVDRAADISERVLHTLDSLENEFKAHRIELGAFVESGIYSRLDPGALNQILSNLLLNAISAMPNGGKLTVALAQCGSYLEFCISDTGAGLRQDQIEHLFEPYFAISQNAFQTKDRGLGLIVAKALIEAEGGELAVRSTLGKGTNFIFRLPHDPQVLKPEPFLERRRFQRVHLTLPVEITILGTKLLTRLTTLSTGGCFVALPDHFSPPPKNTSLTLKLFSVGDTPLQIENARVANIISTGTETGIGIEFSKIDPKTLKVLASIVRGYGF